MPEGKGYTRCGHHNNQSDYHQHSPAGKNGYEKVMHHRRRYTHHTYKVPEPPKYEHSQEKEVNVESNTSQKPNVEKKKTPPMAVY